MEAKKKLLLLIIKAEGDCKGVYNDDCPFRGSCEEMTDEMKYKEAIKLYIQQYGKVDLAIELL